MFRFIFLIIGVGALAGILWHVGLTPLIHTFHQFGLLALLLIFVPMVGVYLLEAYGWQLTLGNHVEKVGFWRLFAIRMVGEVINVTTPTGYMGGEPMKAYLLRRYDVRMVDGMASVVTAKTIMTLAQIMFIVLGLGLMFGILGMTDQNLFAALIGVGTLLFGLGLFMMVQRYGLAVGLLTCFRRLKLSISYLEKRESQLIELDHTIRQFYAERRTTFLFALSVYFLGWLMESLEVYAILYFLGVDVDVLSSVSIAALAVLIKGGTFFIPGSLGAQEGGYLLMLLGFGYDEVTGVAFALVRRMREVIWIMIGLVFLAIFKGQNSSDVSPLA